jgi:hypothetical protein
VRVSTMAGAHRFIICSVIAFSPCAKHRDAGPPAPGVEPTTRCVVFATPAKLAAGESFTKPIGHGLEVRLKADGPRWWHISVGPIDSPEDYLWVVSPPLQTAPHLQIGEGYNVTALQSARLSPRHFRFVTSAREFKDARAFVERAASEAGSGITAADVERNGKGSLEVWITAFEPGPSPESLAWISVRGRACQPR